MGASSDPRHRLLILPARNAQAVSARGTNMVRNISVTDSLSQRLMIGALLVTLTQSLLTHFQMLGVHPRFSHD